MFTDQIEAAIAHASPTLLDELSRNIWQAHGAGGLPDDEAQRFAELIHARKALAKATQKPISGIGRALWAFPPRRTQRPPERSVAIERRRTLAASGVMPPDLASRFTTSELACLRIVADEVRQHGSCCLFIDAIAARAGISRSTVKNALGQAKRLGFIEVVERRRHGAKSLSNIVTIVDRDWMAWLKRGSGIGVKKFTTTDRDGFRGVVQAGSPRQNIVHLRQKEMPRPKRKSASNRTR